MSANMVATWLMIALVFQVIGILIAFVYIFAKSDTKFHILLKIGLVSMVFGLVVQIFRSIHFLDKGTYMVDHYFPLWLSKDIGSIILIYYYSFVHAKVTK